MSVPALISLPHVSHPLCYLLTVSLSLSVSLSTPLPVVPPAVPRQGRTQRHGPERGEGRHGNNPLLRLRAVFTMYPASRKRAHLYASRHIYLDVPGTFTVLETDRPSPRRRCAVARRGFHWWCRPRKFEAFVCVLCVCVSVYRRVCLECFLQRVSGVLTARGLWLLRVIFSIGSSFSFGMPNLI